jgi:hypothetical protein
MTVVSSKEFTTNQDKYFDMALDEQVYIENGNNMFLLIYKNVDDMKHIQGKFVIQAKDRISPQKRTSIQELVMQAPTWTDEEYADFLDARQHINQSRLR